MWVRVEEVGRKSVTTHLSGFCNVLCFFLLLSLIPQGIVCRSLEVNLGGHEAYFKSVTKKKKEQKKKKNRTLTTEHFHSVLLVSVCSCSLPLSTQAHSPYLHSNLSGSIGAYRPFGIFSGFPLLCQCSSAVNRIKLTRSKKCSGYTHSLHFKEAFLLLSTQSDSWSMTWWTHMYLFCSLYILTYCILLVFDL